MIAKRRWRNPRSRVMIAAIPVALKKRDNSVELIIF
jgi:hypothetical protein